MIFVIFSTISKPLFPSRFRFCPYPQLSTNTRGSPARTEKRKNGAQSPADRKYLSRYEYYSYKVCITDMANSPSNQKLSPIEFSDSSTLFFFFSKF